MTAKYIPASLLTVLRILRTFTPLCNDLMSRICATMRAKTTMSDGTDELLSSDNGGLGRPGQHLPKAREMDIKVIVQPLAVLVKHIWYKARGITVIRPGEKCPPSVPELERLCAEAEVLTGVHCSANEYVHSNGELCDGTCIQYARDPSVLPRYRVGPVAVMMSERVRTDDGL